jgi:hypothetical protein
MKQSGAMVVISSHIQAHVRSVLQGILSTGREDPAIYNGTFEGEGARKTRFILNYFNELVEDMRLDLSGVVAVSIGGADGSDLAHIFENTAIRHGILLEYSDAGAGRARERAKDLADHGKTMIVVQGDATQKLEEVRSTLTRFRDHNECSGLALICLGVLHELPTRSPNFDLNHFFSRLLGVMKNKLVFISEPCSPQNWPDRVQLKIGNVSEDDLAVFAEYVRNTLFKNDEVIRPLVDGFASMERDVAAETLFKLIRMDSMERLRLEMQERLTSFKEDECRRILDDCSDLSTESCTRTTSDGFRRAYAACSVVAKDEHGRPLQLPDTHVRIIASNLKELAHTSAPDDAPLSKSRILQPEHVDQLLRAFHQKVLDECETWAVERPPYLDARQYDSEEEFFEDEEATLDSYYNPKYRVNDWVFMFEHHDYSEAEVRLRGLLARRGISADSAPIEFKKLARRAMWVGIGALQEFLQKERDPLGQQHP